MRAQRDAWQALRNLDLWLVMLSYVAYGYFQYLFFYWMGNYFKKELHVPNAEIRNSLFLIYLAQGAGMVFGGLASDVICRTLGVARGRRTVVVVGMSVSALLALLAVTLKDPHQVTVCLAVALGAQGMCEGIYWTTATELGGRARGFAGAFINTGGNVGGFISPVLTPIMAAKIGWPGAIAVACAICAVGGVVWFWIRLPDSEPVRVAPASV